MPSSWLRFRMGQKVETGVSSFGGDSNTWAFPGLLLPDANPKHLHAGLDIERTSAEGRARRATWREVSEPIVEELSHTLLENFEDEAFAHRHKKKLSTAEEDRLDAIKERLKLLSAQGDAASVYSGYVDDPRCTDNAWIETVAVHMHCPSDLGAHLNLCAGEDVNEAIWIDVDHLMKSRVQLYASHVDWLERVATRMARRETSLSSILVRWGRYDVAERVLREVQKEHRQVIMVQPAFQDAVSRSSFERNFNVKLIDLLLDYGCTISACSLDEI